MSEKRRKLLKILKQIGRCCMSRTATGREACFSLSRSTYRMYIHFVFILLLETKDINTNVLFRLRSWGRKTCSEQVLLQLLLSWVSVKIIIHPHHCQSLPKSFFFDNLFLWWHDGACCSWRIHHRKSKFVSTKEVCVNTIGHTIPFQTLGLVLDLLWILNASLEQARPIWTCQRSVTCIWRNCNWT